MFKSHVQKKGPLMNTLKLNVGLCIVLAMLLTACNKESDDKPTRDNDTVDRTEENKEEPEKQEPGNPLGTPKGALLYQLGILKSGDVEKLKACFTERQKDRITAEAIAEGQEEISKFTIDDLYASEERGEYGGHETCKVNMKNGRSLTTLVLTDGKWLADTVWFR